MHPLPNTLLTLLCTHSYFAIWLTSQIFLTGADGLNRINKKSSVICILLRQFQLFFKQNKGSQKRDAGFPPLKALKTKHPLQQQANSNSWTHCKPISICVSIIRYAFCVTSVLWILLHINSTQKPNTLDLSLRLSPEKKLYDR